MAFLMIFSLILLLLYSEKIQSLSDFRRLRFYIDNFKQVTRRYPNHYCCWEETDIPECTPCSIKFDITSNYGSSLLDEYGSRTDVFEIKKNYLFTTTFGQICDNMSISAQEWYTGKVIDLWRITCLNLQPGETYSINEKLGVFKNMLATFTVTWECVGYAGPNCLKICNPTSRTYCDINGDLQCKDGFTDPPLCRLNSPCQNSPCRNGGECQALSTIDYTCVCSQQFTGKKCELQKCDSSKCSGKCENGECVCSSDKIDASCTSYSCDGNFLCKNNGTCGIHGEEIFCVCPPYTSGAYCQFYCDPPCNNGRCTGDKKGNSICSCYSNYIGETCDIELEPTVAKTKNNEKLISLEFKITIALAVIFALLAICLLAKMLADRHNTNILKTVLSRDSKFTN